MTAHRFSAVAVLFASLAAAQTAQPRLNKIPGMLRQGTPPLGIFVSNVSTRGAAGLASSPLDFIIIDMEHSPFDMTRLESYLLAMVDKRRILQKGSLQPDVVPIVRLPANARERVQYMMKQVLDLGAFGVLVPHVETAGDAMAAVRAMRFPQPLDAADAEPRGQRGVGYGWAARYWGLPGPEYARRADLWPLDPAGELLLWCMIESREAIENIHAIAATPGIAGLFVGPSDLSYSLGVPEGDPRAELAIAKVVAACKAAGVPCGTLTSGEGVAKRLAQGFRFLAVGGEGGISAGVERGLQIGRQAKP